MTRFLLWTVGGLFLGLMIHLVVILILPYFASRDLWDQVTARAEIGRIIVLDPVVAGEDNPLGLDPAFVQAICRLDLSEGPGTLSGPMPVGFWAVSVFNAEGIAFYSTTHRASSNNAVNIGIFNPAQTRLLAEQEVGAESDLLVVASPGNEIFAAIRLALPHAVMRDRYREKLEGLACTHRED